MPSSDTPERTPVPEPIADRDTAPALARLLDPLGASAFFGAHWERGPLHVDRADPARFDDLVSLEGIERLLSARELRFPDVQLSRAGTPVPPETYADEANRILPLRLGRLHRDGATVVLSRAHDLFPPLRDLVREVEAALGWRCQANVYLSPPGNRGFGSHYDTHDVFILQVAGRKTFRFQSGGVELPFCDERYDPESTGERVPGESIELAPGDTLYIPRGVLHDAVAHEDAASLHVTLGVFPVVLRDVLREAVQIAAERDVELRRAAPRAGADPGADPGAGSGSRSTGERRDQAGKSLGERLRTLLATALDEEVIDAAMSRLRDDAFLDGRPDCTGLLSGTRDPESLALDTSLVVRSGIAAALERRGAALKLRLPGEVLELDGPMARAVERLVADGGGAVGALSGLDDSRRLALAGQLLEHGVVDMTNT